MAAGKTGQAGVVPSEQPIDMDGEAMDRTLRSLSPKSRIAAHSESCQLNQYPSSHWIVCGRPGLSA
ncbi:MAG: hypothetical protein AB4050_01825 [Synechococcus sp.]